MIRRLPLIPTLLVLAAVAVMIRLGLWQLDRLHEKETLLARYASAETLSADVPFPQSEAATEAALYRHARLDCRRVTGMSVMAGRNMRGEVGMAHVADCQLAGGGRARIVLGWSREPDPARWQGGQVAGVIAPGPRLIADAPVSGLAAIKRPDPAEIPNNHLAYAVQWFLFAATALVIYGVALRRRMRGS